MNNKNRITTNAYHLLLAGIIFFLVLVSGCGQNNRDQISSDDASLHIHMISGSREYRSEPSLRAFKRFMKQQYDDVRITASWGEDAGDDLPDIELLADADLMLVFTRRMVLPEEHLNHIIRHIENEKPVLGIRTASHAFQDFLELDSLVFGGDYDGHGDDEPVRISIAENASDHPVLTDVTGWIRPGKIYHNPDLGPQTNVLLYGKGLDSDIHEPMAWTNLYGQDGRAFYTSMGLPVDFGNENFRNMILNAISWSTKHEL